MRAIPVTDCKIDNLNLKRTHSLQDFWQHRFVRAFHGFDRQHALIFFRLHSDFADGVTSRGLPRISGADYLRVQVGSVSKKHELFALLRMRILILGIKRALILSAAQIRDTDSGKHSPIYFIGRKCARASQNNTGNAGLCQRMPQRHSFALICNPGRRKNIFRTLKVT